jgi:hypothetical protein
MTTPTIAPPRIYIMIENPSKSNNLGPILRCGAAYSATFIFIGYQKCAIEGSHGANKHVQILAYPTFQQGVDYVKKCGVRSIVGILGDASFETGSDDDSRIVCQQASTNSTMIVNASFEISPSIPSKEISIDHEYPCSRPIHLRPFAKNKDICFLISKKPIGLPLDQGRFCDAFVHVSTAAPMLLNKISAVYGLLDCQTTLSLCLHHFAAFVGYKERDFVGQKFQVADRTGFDEERSINVKEERRRKKAEARRDEDDAWESGEMAEMINMFG